MSEEHEKKITPNGNKKSADDELSLAEEKAIRTYLVKLMVLPGIIVTILSFLIGFFIKDIALSKAQADATQQSYNELTSFMDDIYKKIDTYSEDFYTKKNKLENIYNELLALSKNADNVRIAIETYQKATSNDPINSIVSSLVTNKTFTDKVLSNISSQKADDDSGYIRINGIQICWGRERLEVPSSDKNKHVRSFIFEFPRSFSKNPIITNGINADGTGYSFSIYKSGWTTSEYRGWIIEKDSRPTEIPVTMNYIAIGPY